MSTSGPSRITRSKARAASVGAGDDRDSVRSVSSRSSTLRLRAELEAEKELAKIQENLIKKKLELEIAEIEEEGEERSRSVCGDSAAGVQEWLLKEEQTCSSLHRNDREAVHVHVPPPAPPPAAPARAPPAPLPAPSVVVTGGTSDILQLAEIITTISKKQSHNKFDLPIFDGNPVDWINYKSIFEATAANFSNYENAARIKSSLRGAAKYTVEDIIRTGAAPDDIICALEEEYGHPNLLLETAIKKIKNLPRVSDSGAELRNMTAVVRNCIFVLKSIKAEGYLNNPQIIQDILSKLNPYQKAQYGEFVYKIDKNINEDLRISPNLNIILDFLTHLTRTTSYYLPPNYNSDRNNSDRNNSDRNSSGREHRENRDGQGRRYGQGRNQDRVYVNVECSDTVCVLCNKNHLITECSVFKSYDEQQRWELVKINKLCFKCLVDKHSRFQCKAKRCEKCRAPHHVLLHYVKSDAPRVHADPARSGPASSVAPVQGASSALPAAERSTLAAPARAESAALAARPVASERSAAAYGSSLVVSAESVTSMGERCTKSLLKVIPVTVNINNVVRECYALLDDGATVSLIDSRLSGDINNVVDSSVPVYPLRLVSASGHIISDDNSRLVTALITGPNGKQYDVTMRTIKNLELPPQTVPASVLARNVHLKDLPFCAMSCARPTILLGQDNWDLIVNQQIRKGKSGQPVASLTKLGWVVHGPLGTSETAHQSLNFVTKIDDLYNLVKEQFELESIGISELSRKNVECERACKILDSTSRRVDGAWEVGLLWSRDDVHLPDNYDYALKRLRGVEHKMDKNPEYAALYTSQIERLLTENYAKSVDGPMSANPVWWLPHFGVTNPNKPGKLRLVYDAAAKYQNTCLNDFLLTGPDLLNSLLGVLFKFRAGPIAYSGDICDMFMRIKIRKEDQGAQLFLWRGQDRSRDPNTYVMDSMIFGAKCSPTSAIYILNKNASEFAESHPEAVEAIHKRHYMDDYLDSRDTIEEARQLINDVSMIHAAGGFTIRGWVTNSPELREELPAVTPTKVNLEKSPSGERTLGMIWIPETDELAFDLSFKKLPPEIVEGRVVPSKRRFLQFVMSIFDPLGLLCPYTIKSKILLQMVWRSGIDWDEELKVKEFKEWEKWLQDIKQLTNMRIPRWYSLMSVRFELHVFGDASELAYAAVAFLVGHDAAGNPAVAMVAGKARVAPLKVVSIPRLELQAAVLACRLANTIEKEQAVTISSRYLWSDSKTVLKWIHSDPRDFQKFVSHRLAEIDRKSNTSEWRWVPSADNPAYEATKMYWPTTCNLWLTGPEFLRQPKDKWPVNEFDDATSDENLERLEKVHSVKQYEPLIDVRRFSSWVRAVRTAARVLAFVGICRKKQTESLTASNIHDAELLLIRQSQTETFPKELNGSVLSDSKIRQLDPFVYEGDGLLRVRGRLLDAPNLSFGERHPIILDGRSYVTQLIVGDYHKRMYHANHETVINSVREKFWVTHLRRTLKSVVSRCQYCRVRHALPAPPKMADLPSARLENTRRAFVNCGIDYFGPMEVAIGRRREKRWGVIFTCLVTRAIHLEIAASLSGDSAIMAIRRFIARRGQPAVIFSDRGTNFVLANKEMNSFALNKGIQWRFNPPATPHMGGCWERLIRSVKSALNVVLKERAPREEILQTFFAEVEMTINSRPLTYVCADAEGPIVLTPNHLLLGTASGASGLASFEATDLDGRKAWRKAQALADMFWRRWSQEYLPTLHRRQKWQSNAPPIKVGDIVLISDKNQPRNTWPRGVISAVHPGRDGHIRIVNVKTANGHLERPVVKVVVLPTEVVPSEQGGGM